MPANSNPPKNEPDAMVLMRQGYHASPMFPVGNFNAAPGRALRWGYYRLIEKVDAEIGKVPAALRAAGENVAAGRDQVVVENSMSRAGIVGDFVPMTEGRMVRTKRDKYSVFAHGQRRESLVDAENWVLPNIPIDDPDAP